MGWEPETVILDEIKDKEELRAKNVEVRKKSLKGKILRQFEIQKISHFDILPELFLKME